MWRKVGSWILLVLAVGGLVICLAGLVGVWVARSQVDPLAESVLDTAQGYLGTAASMLKQVDDGLSTTITTVDGVQTATEEMVAAGQSPAVETLQALLGEDFLARAGTIEPLVQGALTTATGINDSLVAMNRLPGVDLPVFTDEIAQVQQRLGELQTRVNGLVTTVQEADGSRIIAATDQLSQWLGETQTKLGETEVRVSSTQAQLSGLQERFPSYTLWAAAALSLFLLLMAAGQVSLIADCWRWARG